MKKIIMIFLIFIVGLPLNIKAISTYNDAVKIANNYIYGFSDYERYILLNKNVSYIFENNKLINNRSEFINGGFLSKTEFDISNINGMSYLSPGIKYWTLSDGKEANTKNVIDYTIDSMNINKKTGIRVTEFVISTIAVTGSGSMTNPWEFVDIYKITVKSDKTLGQVEDNSICYAKANESALFNVSTKYGYEYDNISCSESKEFYEDYYNYDLKKLRLSNIKSDLNCNLSFKNRTYNYTFNNNGGSSAKINGVEVNEISLRYAEGWYKGLLYVKKLSSVPLKTGYIFSGYYAKDENNNEIPIIDSDGNIIQNGFSFFANDLTSYVLLAKYKPIKYIIKYNGNGATSGSMDNTQHEYDSNIIIPGSKYLKTNYSFQGWALTATGEIEYKKDDIKVNLGSNEGQIINLYAIWKEDYHCLNGTLTYDSSKGYICLVNASLESSPYSCNCSTCSATTCDTCTSTSCQTCSSPYSCNCYSQSYSCNCVTRSYSCNCQYISKTCSYWQQNNNGGNWGWGGHMVYYECGYTACLSTCYYSSCSTCYRQVCGTCYNYYSCNCQTNYYQCNCQTNYYQCNCQTCYSQEYYCPNGWNIYSGSGSSTKCYKAATLG